MPYSISVKREYEMVGVDLSGDLCSFGRGVNSWGFRHMASVSTKIIAKENDKYLAFPEVVKKNNSLICLYTKGDAHAMSDQIVMARSDDSGHTWTSVVFYDASAPGVYNTSLLNDVLSEDEDFIILKVYLIKNRDGTLGVTQLGNVSGYAPWSRVIAGKAGKLWRTGYSFSESYGETALLESPDGESWSVKSVIAPLSDSKKYSEADIVPLDSSKQNLLAVIRCEEAGNPLYSSTSDDYGETWSSPSKMTGFDGVQPNLLSMSDGTIALAAGDRSGVSGISATPLLQGGDVTGIGLWVSSDGGTTWSYKTQVAGIYSTDGGQPMCNEIGTHRVNIVYYGRDYELSKPNIYSVSLDISNL